MGETKALSRFVAPSLPVNFDPERTRDEMLVSQAAAKKAAWEGDAEGVVMAIERQVRTAGDLVHWWETVAVKDKGGQWSTGNRSVTGTPDICPLSRMEMHRLKKKVSVLTNGAWRVDPGKMEQLFESLISRYGKTLIGEQAQDIGGIAISTGFYEWYTPQEYIEAARQAMGSIDLDPASCEAANETVKASMFYTKEDNGLQLPWTGNVFVNPPYSSELVKGFAQKLADTYLAGEVKAGVFLVHNATDASWWQSLAGVASAVCFPSSRINFINGKSMQQDPGSSIRGQSVLYLGGHYDAFVNAFKQFGIIMAADDAAVLHHD